MDVLRANNLANMISNTDEYAEFDKKQVNTLVNHFAQLTKHEKMLFLINIREFTNENNGASACNGTTIPAVTVKEEPQDPGVTTNTSTTPQAQRLLKTSNWLQKTFIQDNETALPKAEMYLLYRQEFQRQNEKPISTADFGKLIRSVFPNIKARRLGQRGQSKYCYANIRKRSEIEKPALPTVLPCNELITWGKQKFNIDFTDSSQVVSYLKCEHTNVCTRKRRASCGVVKTKNNPKGHQRSASVSVLELDTKDDPLISAYDNESLEIGSYFENGNSTQWPQLRSLLTDNEASNSGFSLTSGIIKKKRHMSSFEFVKPSESLTYRSQSVPVPGDEEHNTSYFDELLSKSSNTNTRNNPLLTSSLLLPVSHTSTSSCSSGSSAALLDAGEIGGGGGGGNGTGDGGNTGVGDREQSVIESVELQESSLHHSDVFFDSVFDLMMNDCQN